MIFIYPLLILLVNLIYIPAIWYGLVNDDATTMKLEPFPVRRNRIFSLLLQIAVAEFIYLAFGANHISFIAAVLFSVHPLCVQVPVWIAGRYYGYNALLFLMILAFAPFASPLYFWTNSSITTVLFTPLLFAFTKHWYIALLFPILAYRSFREIKTHINGKINGDGTSFSTPLPADFTLHKFKPRNLIIVVKTFGYYALACLLPIKNGFFNSFLVTLGASDKETNRWFSLNRHFWGGLFAICLMASVWWFNKFNFIGLGIMLFVLSIGPFLNFITIQQCTAPRYAYVPLIGFQIALVSLAFMLPVFARSAILGGLFVFYLDRTLRVIKHYAKDNITMMELDSQVFPDNPRIWYYRYEHMLHKGNPVMAFAEASYGLKHLPEDCQLWFGLACACFELGDMPATLKFLDTSERFMMLTERKNMQSLISEMRDRVNLSLQGKWKNPQRGIRV